MRQIVIALLLCCAAVAQTAKSGTKADSAQGSSSTATGKRSAAKAKAGSVPDEGSVASGTYSEKFFNVSYAIPENWIVKTAEMRQGLAGQENAILLFSAFAKEKSTAGQVNPSITISAENIAAYPKTTTTSEYFEALSQVVTSKGFTVANEPAEIEVGGVTFLRGDFQKQDGDTTIFQATMVALRKGHFLTVTAISGNDEELTPLLNRLHIFAPPTLNR